MENIKTYTETDNAISTWRKLHRAERSYEFIESCIAQRVVPTFARLGTNTKNTLEKCQMSSEKISNLERKCLNTELRNQLENIEYFRLKLDSILHLLKQTFIPTPVFETHKFYIENKVLH